jgi:hypothetical protein
MDRQDIIESRKPEDGKKAIQKLMEALRAMPFYSVEEVLADIGAIRGSWGNSYMVKGSYRKITKIIKKNLKEFSQCDDFKYFRIIQIPADEKGEEKASAHIDVIFAGRFSVSVYGKHIRRFMSRGVGPYVWIFREWMND